MTLSAPAAPRLSSAGVDDATAAQLAVHDRFRRRLSRAATPAQRLRDMARLQHAAWDLLRRSPAGYAHFIRRNFKARATFAAHDPATTAAAQPQAPVMSTPPDPTPLFDTLRRHGVPFVIVGGHAVNFHGYVRATESTEVVWLRSPESEDSLARALAEVDAKYIGNDIDPTTGIERTYPVTPAFVRASHLMMLWTIHGFLSLFDHVPGVPDTDVGELFASAVEADGLRFPSLGWLRRMKQAAGRTKDLLDLENLPEA